MEVQDNLDAGAEMAHEGVDATINQTDTQDIARPASSAQSENTGDADQGSDREVKLFNTPTIPTEVYANLPDTLRNQCDVFQDEREKDVFLTGALTILSGRIQTVKGVYDNREVFSNINCFIVAPPASGKGMFIYSKMLGEAFHTKLLEESNAVMLSYAVELSGSEADDCPQESITSLPPKKPPFKILFIPGNASSSAIIKHLMDSDGKGIFFETEADTLTNTLQQDWGNFSDLFRKAFHHETVSYSRKTNNEFYEIKKPCLSVGLSGTPAQVERLIPSAEDGLFSRFIFYAFTAEPTWRDVAPVSGRIDYNSFFEAQSNRVLELAEFINSGPRTFNLTEGQWSTLNSNFKVWFDETNSLIGGDALSSIKRLGLILYRTAMILTCVRRFDATDSSPELICSDVDFNSALQLVGIYKEHALLMFGRLPKTGNISELAVANFYKALPTEFTRREAVAVGEKVGIQERTVDKYLVILVNNKYLIKPKHGFYSKEQQ